jgi:cyclopropane fatty-acyl-phospholipid synthase-like methyltransferase
MTAVESQYLDGEYFSKNPSFHVEDSPWKASQILRMLQEQGIQPQRVAEVGCGAGEIIVQMARHLPSAEFHGYEISPQGFALCKTREQQRIQYFHCDILEGAGDAYDLVLCIDVFEHIEDYFKFLRNLRRTGKTFIFHIPLDMNVRQVLRSEAMLNARRQVGHIHYFSKATAIATLEDCGYKVKSSFYTRRGPRRKTLFSSAMQIPRDVLMWLTPDKAAALLGGYSLLVHAVPSEQPSPVALQIQ